MKPVSPSPKVTKWPIRSSSRITTRIAKKQSPIERVLVLTVVDAYRESRMTKQKVHSLTGRITPELMLAAFKAVKRNRGAAGIDKISIKMFEANLEDNLQALMKDLKKGSFEPKPLRRVFIPKNETEFRPLGIPSVRDRVAQEVIRRLLAPIFEPMFHPYRPSPTFRTEMPIRHLKP